MASLINGLGGDAGFGENSVSRNDDGNSGFIDLTSIFPSGLNFFGTSWTGVYINTNGNITFSSGLSGYTPQSIGTGYTSPIIAPFWADVDTRNTTDINQTTGGTSTGSNLVWYDINPETGTFTVTWDDVGYYSYNNDKANAFQLQLVSTGSGNFDIIYRYEDVNWTTGDASSGVDGLGGQVARAGFSAGDGANYLEFTFSGDQNYMLSLENTVLAGSDEAGKWTYHVNGGSVQGVGQENSDDTITGSDGSDMMDGRSGNDTLYAGTGDDNVNGGLGDDILYGEAGDDRLAGGDGNNTLDGGDGTDYALYSGIRNTLSIHDNGDGTYTVDRGTLQDLLANIEYVSFDDGSMSVPYAVEVRDNQEEFSRFYNALFGRDPDQAGLAYWVNDLINPTYGGNGNTIQGAAQAFTESSEFQTMYGASVSDADFVNLLYQNILHRAADQAGYNYWLPEIQASGDRGGMIVSFANSTEYMGETADLIDTFLGSVPLDGYILV